MEPVNVTPDFDLPILESDPAQTPEPDIIYPKPNYHITELCPSPSLCFRLCFGVPGWRLV